MTVAFPGQFNATPAGVQLRPYQRQVDAEIDAAWNSGHRNVLAVMPTGAGKTVLFAKKIMEHGGFSIAIAHRQELVSQISLALARNGVRHKILAPDAVVRFIVSVHMSEVGGNFYDPNASCTVAGVDTLTRLDVTRNPWLQQVTFAVIDEAHHVLEDNKWGKAFAMLPNAKVLGVTATPERADGKGLGVQAEGIFHNMIGGPTMRDLIRDGFLTEYKIYCPPSDIELHKVAVSQATGEYNKDQLSKARKASHLTGDVVRNYLRIARGKRAVVFDVDVASATETAGAFNAAGVRAEVVSAKTPDSLRIAIIRRFRNAELDVLVNVDLFGEGFDLPAIECVIMARPTQSYALYVQQFGRALRLMTGKPFAIIIDHVGNVVRHKLPDAPREWSLERKEKRGRNGGDGIPLTVCTGCVMPFERIHRNCPWCGGYNAPAENNRSAPEFVDGDLHELDPQILAALRGEIDRIDCAPTVPRHLDPIAAHGMMNRHHERQVAQAGLREAMAWWGGYQKALGRSDSESQRRFYFAFGVDVGTAQTLGRREAEGLDAKVRQALAIDGVVISGHTGADQSGSH